MNQMRSATSLAKFISWVTHTIVIPSEAKSFVTCSTSPTAWICAALNYLAPTLVGIKAVVRAGLGYARGVALALRRRRLAALLAWGWPISMRSSSRKVCNVPCIFLACDQINEIGGSGMFSVMSRILMPRNCWYFSAAEVGETVTSPPCSTRLRLDRKLDD